MVLWEEVSIDIGIFTLCIRNVIDNGSTYDIKDVHIRVSSLAVATRLIKTIRRLVAVTPNVVDKTAKRSSDVGYEYLFDSGHVEDFEEVRNETPDTYYHILESWYINIKYKLKVIVKQAKLSVVVSNKQITISTEELRYNRTSPQSRALLFDRDLMLSNISCFASNQEHDGNHVYGTVRVNGYSKYSASDDTFRVGQIDAVLDYEHLNDLLSLIKEVDTVLPVDKKSVTFASEEAQDLVQKNVATLVALYKCNRYRFRYTNTEANMGERGDSKMVRIRSLTANVINHGISVCTLSCGGISISKTVAHNRLYHTSRTCSSLSVIALFVLGANHWAVQDVHVDSTIYSNCISTDATNVSVSLKLVSLQWPSFSYTATWTTLNDLLQQYSPLVKLLKKRLFNNGASTFGVSLHFKCGYLRVQTSIAGLSVEGTAKSIDVSTTDLSSGKCTILLSSVKVQARDAMYASSAVKIALGLQYNPFDLKSFVKYCTAGHVLLEYRNVGTLSIRSVVTDKRLSRASLQLPPLVLSRIDLNLFSDNRDVVVLPLTLHSEYCVFKVHQSTQKNEKVEVIVTNTLVTVHIHEDYNTQLRCPRVFTKMLLPTLASAISLVTQGKDDSGLTNAPICVAMGSELQMRVKQLDSVDHTPKSYIHGRFMTVKGPFKFRAMLDLTSKKGVNHFEVLYKSLIVEYVHTKKEIPLRVLKMQSSDNSNVLKVFWKLTDGTVDQVVLQPLEVLHVHTNYDYLSFLSKFIDRTSSVIFSSDSSNDVASSWLIKGIQSYLEKTLYSIPSLITNLQTWLHVPIAPPGNCLGDSNEFNDDDDSLLRKSSSKQWTSRYFLHACKVEAKLLLTKSYNYSTEQGPPFKSKPALSLSLVVRQCQFHAIDAINIGDNISLQNFHIL